MYHVVFEYTKNVGGYAGTRFAVGYRDRISFMQTQNDPNTKVLAAALTQEQALDLTSLTPEVCRFTAAIEEACYKSDGTVDTNILGFRLNMAVFAVNHDRLHILENCLTREGNIVVCEVGPEPTEKNRLLRLVLEHGDNSLGYVDVLDLNLAISSELLSILADREE